MMDLETGFGDYSWWKAAWWAVGTFGIVGTIALIVLGSMYFPDLLRRIVAGFVRIFTFVLSYRIGCAIVAAIVVGLAVDYWRHDKDDAEFAKRTALFEHAQKQRDERIRVETRDDVWKEIADATAENVVIDKDVKEFTDAPPPQPAPASNPYRIDPVSRVRLCHIAGQTECGPVSPQRVQARRRPSPNPRH
jgi:hypothetical protein